MALNIVDSFDDRIAIRTVLLSVSDKSSLEDLARAILETQPEAVLLSTGGTFRVLKDKLGSLADNHLREVSDYTGQPEMQGGLVKTLDFKIYLGLLSETYNQDHAADLKRTDAVPIDMVVVNLYPFRETLQCADLTAELARTNIDIGGPCMVRAAAKNYLRVASVTDPADYDSLAEELRTENGTIGFETRMKLMCKAFAHTAAYDRAIAEYMAGLDTSEVRAVYRQIR